jgi:hypothetical protein
MILTLLSCRETLRRLDDYLDCELSPWQMRLMRGHLKLCHACNKKFVFERRFTDVLRNNVQVVTLQERILPVLSSKVPSRLQPPDVCHRKQTIKLPNGVLKGVDASGGC